MKPNDERYRSALRRNIAEVNNAILKRNALIGLHAAESAHGLDFFRVASHALNNDIISHVLRVLDHGAQSSSFWYIVRTNEGLAKTIACENDVSLDEIERLSASFKHIRDKTHFHIDRDAVTNPAQVWADADIIGDELGYVLEGAWKVLAGIASQFLNETYELANYDGSDVKDIIYSYKKMYPEVPIVI